MKNSIVQRIIDDNQGLTDEVIEEVVEEMIVNNEEPSEDESDYHLNEEDLQEVLDGTKDSDSAAAKETSNS